MKKIQFKDSVSETIAKRQMYSAKITYIPMFEYKHPIPKYGLLKSLWYRLFKRKLKT